MLKANASAFNMGGMQECGDETRENMSHAYGCYVRCLLPASSPQKLTSHRANGSHARARPKSATRPMLPAQSS